MVQYIALFLYTETLDKCGRIHNLQTVITGSRYLYIYNESLLIIYNSKKKKGE
jgi:hypothetical protein